MRNKETLKITTEQSAAKYRILIWFTTQINILFFILSAGRPGHMSSPEGLASPPDKQASEDRPPSESGHASPTLPRDPYHQHTHPQLPSPKSKYDDKSPSDQQHPRIVDHHQQQQQNQPMRNDHQINKTMTTNFSLNGILSRPDNCSSPAPTDLSLAPKMYHYSHEGQYQNGAHNIDRSIVPNISDRSDDDSDAEIDLTSHSGKEDSRNASSNLYGGVKEYAHQNPLLNEMVPNDLSMNCSKNGADWAIQ